jgi:hypothetical protein
MAGSPFSRILRWLRPRQPHTHVLLLALGLCASLSTSSCTPPNVAPPALPSVERAVVTTVAGSGKTGPLGGGYADGPALQALFHEPAGLHVDTAGNIYVSDWVNHRVRLIASDGQVSTVAGSGPSGPRGEHRDGPTAEARFFGPQGLTMDESGNLLVTDSRNNCVRRIGTDGYVTTIAGSGLPGLLENLVDGPASRARFGQPSDVAVSADGRLFVADFLHHCIRLIDGEGSVSTWAGTGLPGAGDGVGRDAEFELPNRLAIDHNGVLYVTEGRARDIGERLGGNRVRQIRPDGRVTTLAGTGEPGYRDGQASQAQFDIPTGIAVDARGNVYVADTGNHRIRLITPDGVVSTLAGDGTPGLADGPASQARFWYPMDVAVAPDGSVIVADGLNHRIRKVSLGPPAP